MVERNSHPNDQAAWRFCPSQSFARTKVSGNAKTVHIPWATTPCQVTEGARLIYGGITYDQLHAFEKREEGQLLPSDVMLSVLNILFRKRREVDKSSQPDKLPRSGPK